MEPISKGMIEYIIATIPPCKVLELGSGEGSQPLVEKGYEIIAVEHDKEWLGRLDNITYVYAPIKWHKPIRGFPTKEFWYDKKVIGEILHDYGLIIVDGPPADIGRAGFLKYIDLFDTGIPIIFDDLHRGDDHRLAVKVSARLRRPLLIMETWEPEHWGVV